MSQLGIVTYNIAKDWDLPTILTRLEKLGIRRRRAADDPRPQGRSQPDKAEREEVRKRFEDSPVQLAGLGSAFEYQATDPAVVRKNIDGTKEYVRLAHDIGAPGVKVRPNGVPQGADLDATLQQIGRALHEVGEDASGFRRRDPRRSPRRRDSAAAKFRQDHRSTPTIPMSTPAGTRIPTDVKDGSIKETFALVAPKIHEVHLRDLTDEEYPWRAAVCPLERPEVRGLHPRRDSREHRPRPRAPLFPRALAGLSAPAMSRLPPPGAHRIDPGSPGGSIVLKPRF